jgi:3-hexulose-6-phosphate synthase
MSKHEISPVVQLSLDVTSIDEALELAGTGMRAGVDWLEAGRSLILAEGLKAVRALRDHHPFVPIVADLRTVDNGYLEAEMMALAGASMVVVMGVAHPATVRAAVRAGRDYGIKVMGDVMLAPDKVECAKQLEANGVDYIVVHTGLDERQETPGLSPLDDLPAIRDAVKIPVQAVGGLTIEQITQLPGMGAPLFVVSAPLAVSEEEMSAGLPGETLEQALRHVVEAVHGKR